MRALVIALALPVIGCGGAANAAAHETLVQLGHGLHDVEDAVGDAQAAERGRVVAEQVTQAEGRKRLSPYWRVGDAAVALRSLLFAAESALDATGADGFAEIAPCIAAAIARLTEGLAVLGEIGVELPDWPWLRTAMAALSAYGTQCGGE